MTAKQIALHWREWQRALAAMRAAGAIGPTSKDAETARKAIYSRLSRPLKSIKAMGNGQLSEFLTVCWAWTRVDDEGLQLQFNPEMQAAIIARFVCSDIFALISEIDPKAGDKPDAYYDGIYRQMHGPDSDPDTGTHDQWHPVIVAACYRYDQVARKALGQSGKGARQARRWPYNHERILRQVAATSPQTHAEPTPF